MKSLKLFAAVAALLSCMAAKAQELVIRIDDMGALHSVNVASIDTYQNGIAKSVEVLVVGSWFPEAVKMLKENPGLDDEIDNTVTRVSRDHKGENLIFDSRMAWHFAEDTFKIFLTIEPMEAANRVFYNRVSAEESYTDVNDACEKLVERSVVERKRFIEIYGVDYYDFNNYNLVVDTTNKTPDEVVAVIMENYNSYVSDPEGYGATNC